MMQSRRWTALCVMLVLAGTVAFTPILACAAWCPMDSVGGVATFNSKTGPVSIRVIYVTFPDEQYGPQQLTEDQAIAIPSAVGRFFQHQSRGSYTPSVSVLADPRTGHETDMWMAQYTCMTYRTRSNMVNLQVYPDCWDESTLAESYLGALQAEIMHTIYNTYISQSPPLANPFDGIDMLIFIYAGGLGFAGPLGEDWDGYGALFVEHASRPWMASLGVTTASPPAVSGVALNWRDKYLTEMTICHEVGHLLGLNHTIGSYPGAPNYNPNTYFFGVYSGMRAEDIKQQGCVPFHVVDLMSISDNGISPLPGLGWYAQPIPVTEHLKGLRLYDIRNASGQGKVYRIDLPPFQLEIPGGPVLEQAQYFLVCYHAGMHEDGELNAVGQPILPSRGLEIWHCVEDQMGDLEVASGRFNRANGQWGDPNPSDGYDTMDRYPDRDYEEYRQHAGTASDFFSLAAAGVERPGEFSFRTNPNTAGLQNAVATPGTWVRRIPQTVVNSLLIRVLDEQPALGYADVDILLAPYEDVSYPNGGEVLRVGAPTTIAWNVDASLEIGTVDIMYSADGGVAYEVVAAGEANDGEYIWTPESGQESSAGKIKMVFHNTRSVNVGEDESNSTFTVAGPAFYTDASDYTGLDYVGVPYSSVVLDYDNDGKKDLFISMRDYAASMQWQVGLAQNNVPQFQEKTDDVFAAGSEPQYGLRGLAAADYDNDGAVDFFAAAASGARLYHNCGGTFADSATACGLSSYATNSWAGAWGDYDRDGQLDLYIARGEGAAQDPTPTSVTPLSGYILRNRIRESDSFVGTEIEDGATNASIAAAWADVDGDSDLDLFVGDIRSSAVPPICRLYINEGEGMFTEDFANRFSVTDLAGITSVGWVDCDNSGSLDLVVGGQLQAPMVFLNDGAGYFDSSAPLVTGLSAATNGVRPLDHDLDGRMDLVVLPQESSDHPWLLANRNTSSGIGLVDESMQAGLEASVGRVDGMVAADFNGDGDEDLYLGRVKNSGMFFYQAKTSSGDAPTANWVGVRLEPSSGANNNDGIGATVTVAVGDPAAPIFKQSQVVDGGSGRGGQADWTLIFGLGDLEGTVQAQVRWPGGYVQTQQLVAGTVNVVSDLTAPTMVFLRNQSPVFSYEAVPGTEFVDWVFTWQTEFSCDPSLDQVRVSCRPNQPSTCLCEERTLHVGDPSVLASVHAMANGRYEHSLRWRGVWCFAPCGYNFTMGSATQRAGSLNELGLVGTISLCPTYYDPDPAQE